MQSPGVPDRFNEVLLWTAVVIVLLVGLWVVWVWLRRRFHDDEARGAAASPWSLQELRELRDQGHISATEFETLRRQVIGMVRDTQDPPPET